MPMSKQTTRTNAELILGFDAGCQMCSSMAHRLKSDVGDKIDVLPLDNQSMYEWRHSVFADPPWSPTLIKLDSDGAAKAGWVGWKIGPALGATLGPTTASQALYSIGQQRIAGSQGRLKALSESKHSRRNFGRLALGAASVIAGATVVFGKPGTALAAGPSNLQVARTETMTAGAAKATFQQQSEGADGQEVLQRAHSTVAYTQVNSRSDVEFGAWKMELKDGNSTEASYGYDKSAGEMVILQDNLDLIDGRASAAWLLRIDNDANDPKDSTFTILEESANGELVELVDPTEAAAAQAANKDPCGGCTGGTCKTGGKELRSSCRSSSVVACVLAGAGCAMCATCSGTGSCIACAVISCGSILVSCCDKKVGPACQRCQRVC